jgi:hypothetical protein
MFTLYGAVIGTPGGMSPEKGKTNTRERGHAQLGRPAPRGAQTDLDSLTDKTDRSA